MQAATEGLSPTSACRCHHCHWIPGLDEMNKWVFFHPSLYNLPNGHRGFFCLQVALWSIWCSSFNFIKIFTSLDLCAKFCEFCIIRVIWNTIQSLPSQRLILCLSLWLSPKINNESTSQHSLNAKYSETCLQVREKWPPSQRSGSVSSAGCPRPL